jgi:hypothetical protein
MHFSLINIEIFNFLLSYTYFKAEGSSSGRQLCIQLWYGTFYMRLYKQSSREKSVFDTFVVSQYFF